MFGSNNARPRTQGVYPGSGVAQGGQQGRSATVHMGVGATRQGGTNPFGSARGPFSAGAATSAIGRGVGGATHVGSAIHPYHPAAPVTAHPAAAVPAIDYHNLPQYGLDVATANHNAQTQRDDIAAQLAQLQANYNLGSSDLNHWYDRDTYDSNAALAARGIFFSGSRDQAFGDRNAQRDQRALALSQQYGQGAQDGLARQLADVNWQNKAQISQADLNAKAYYDQMYPAPAAPIAAQVAAPAVAAVAKPKPAPAAKPKPAAQTVLGGGKVSAAPGISHARRR